MQIFAVTLAGKTLTMDVDSRETISSLKSRIIGGIFPDQLRVNVMFAGKQLEDWKAVGDYEIRNNSTVNAVVGLAGGIRIKVKTLTGKEISIDIEPTDKIERVKERVEEREGIPPLQQRLIYGGKQLSDVQTVAELKIESGASLHLVLALRGGGGAGFWV